MIKSMTGFGRGESSDDLNTYNVEIKTVNHRYNDIVIRMPKHLNYLEEDLKRLIKTRLIRGRIEVFIKLDYIDGASLDVSLDMNLAKAYKAALDNLQEELGIVDHITMANILGFQDIIKTERKEIDEDESLEKLSEAVEEAVGQVLAMREKEGELLYEDIKNHVKKLILHLENIEKRASFVVEEYRFKLEERLENLLEDGSILDQERLENELVFFADRSDINEEIVRFKSHIEQLLETIESEESVGRRLDFLIQEMNREVNTIGSKSSDLEITREVVNIKSEIEKIREQVQNVE